MRRLARCTLLENDTLRLMGSYAYSRRKRLSNAFKLGQGLIGQAALEKQTITLAHVPEDYLAITSGLGQLPPQSIVVAPFMYEGHVIGAIELGTLADLTDAQLDFFDIALENIAIAFNTAQARTRINELLTQTQQQAAELGTQQEELRAINEDWRPRPSICKPRKSDCAPSKRNWRRPTSSWKKKPPPCKKSKTSWTSKTASCERPAKNWRPRPKS